MELKNEMKKLYNEKEEINSFMRKYFYCAKKIFFSSLVTFKRNKEEKILSE